MAAETGFVDEAQINARGGDGGAGVVSFRREAHVPKGGPDGGNGGKGGDLILRADRNVASLLSFRDHPHRRAESGTHGSGNKRNGAAGADLIVAVPIGTMVRDADGRVLADLVAEGDSFVAAPGGRGGRGNASFASARRRIPGFAEQGEYGEERWLRLELKLMADVALVGFPNAGKSTLISSVSAAKPKIADYPFTTLVPHLGVVRFQEHEFVMADIPGLIEGASEGKGLGHQFLRHVERARVLLVLVDLGNVEGRRAKAQEEVLLRELAQYQPELLNRPRLVIGSKADVADPALADEFDGLRVSAVTRDGIDALLGQLGLLVREARASEPERESFVVHRPEGEGFAIQREDDGAWRVVGRQAERAVAMADLDNSEAALYVQQRLRRMGVDRALNRAGVREGDTVRIGGIELEYVPDALGARPYDEPSDPPRRRRAAPEPPARGGTGS
ncbi:MAG TPA: GTPase ObgE [Acidimicrobiia bacterium]|nr:GTPase ObgE [Acidimicrobiia bacterium]